MPSPNRSSRKKTVALSDDLKHIAANTVSVLSKDGTISDDDYRWVIEPADDAQDDTTQDTATVPSIAADEHLLVSTENLSLLAQTTGKKGVLLTVTDDVQALLTEQRLSLDTLDIVAINFANFNDGRGYSFASLLRRAGYTGELRAVGDVFKDTLFYMKRCGFDSYVLKADKSLDEAKSGLTAFTQGYQATEAQAASHFQVGTR